MRMVLKPHFGRSLLSYLLTAALLTNHSIVPSSANAADPVIIYVNHQATGSNNGTSWPNAYKNFWDALTRAGQLTGPRELWVAKGSYASGTDPRGQLILGTEIRGIGIYGGFNGNETTRAARNPKTNVTIMTNPQWHSVGLSEPATIIDGFDFQTNDMWFQNSPAVVIRNNIFRQTVSMDSGGIVENNLFEGPVRLDVRNNGRVTSNLFKNITASPAIALTGGVVAANNTIVNAQIAISMANIGAIGGKVPTVVNNVVVSNLRGIYKSGTGFTPVISNNLAFNNRDGDYSPSSIKTATDLQVDPQFVAPTSGNYSLQSTSPARDTGLDSVMGSELDFEGNPRFIGSHIDRGAFEFKPTGSTVGAPIILPISGGYPSSTNITINCPTIGASIYYTTDNSVPTQSSTLYTGGFNLTSDKTIKARAFKSGMNESPVVQETYRTFKTIRVRAATSPSEVRTEDGTSWATAYKSVQAAAAVAQNGDQMWVARGTYVGDLTIKTAVSMYGGFAGTENQLTDRNSDRNQNLTTLDSFNFTIYGVAANPFVLERFEIIKNLRIGDSLITVRDNRITGQVQANNMGLIENNRFENSLGVYIANGAVVKNNLFYTPIGMTPRAAYTIILSGNGKIYNNTIVGEKQGFRIHKMPTAVGTPEVVNNIVAFGSGKGMEKAADTGLIERNNLVFGNALGDFSGFTRSSSDLQVDPRFVNRAANDFHLLSNSPAKEAGDNTVIEADDLDYDNLVRKFGPIVDIGALENRGGVTPVNNPPTASITSPANGATFTAPATIAISGTAADSDGTVAKVEFYRGTTKLGEDTSAPYSFNWTGVTAGTYSLTVRAIDNNDASTTSTAVSITVNNPNVQPTVSITSPTNGATFTAPASITISGTASDSDGTVSKVEFFEGTNKLGEDTNAPYSFAWTNVAAGSYSLTARATDNSGALRTSTPVAITVSNPNVLPTASITSPVTGATFIAPALVVISGTASDTDGTITKLEFFRGTTKLGEDTTAPYSFNWSGVSAGSYALTVRATDNNGGVTNSAAVNITVSNPNVLPTVAIVEPTMGEQFVAPATIVIQAQASDSDGTVSKVEFFQGTTKLGEDTSSPYSFTWNNVAAGTYMLTARATDNSGGVTTSTVIGTSVRNPNVAPTVSLTSPANGATFTAPGTVVLNATASDSDGSIAKVEFYRGITKLGEDTTSPYSFTWSGVSAGSYSLTAKAIDDEDASTTSTAVSITVNDPNVVPNVSITSPATGASFIAPANIVINATASDSDGTVSKVEFFRGTTKLGEDTTSPYSFSWNGVSAGGYSLTAVATDNDGDTKTSTAVGISVRDLNAPTVSITNPNDSGVFTAPATIVISATAADTDGTITKVEFFHGTTKIGEDATAPYSVTWSNVSAGTYMLTARATDNDAAVTTSTDIGILVENPNAGPIVSITNPANAATFTAPATITLSATAGDNDGTVSKVEFFRGTTKLGEDASSPYTFNWTGVTAGGYSLTARATDNDGATTTSSAVNITVENPNGLPTVSITSPAGGTTYTAPATVVINGTATDSDGTVSKVEFFQGATKLGEDASAPYSFSWANVAAGSYSLTARATDNDGATRTSTPISITVNPANIPPTISITNPLGAASFIAPASITINATAADANGSVDLVEFFQGTTKVGEDDTAPYSFIWSGVGAGSYSLTARATDNQGATTTSAAVAISVRDVDAPSVAITSPVIGSTFNTPATVLINATATDSDGTVTKVEFFQGATKLGEDTSSPYSFNWTNVSVGNYSLTARATDNDDETTVSAPISITVSNPNNPVISFVTPANGAQFDAPATVSIRVNATSNGSTIDKVEFFEGNNLLSEDTQAPYEFEWTGVSAGEYDLRAVATDTGDRSSEANITIRVNSAANDAPVIVLSPSITAQLPNPIDLSATITDDGFPNPPGVVTVRWEQINGPGLVTFGTEDQALTSVVFPLAGTYLLRVYADDGGIEVHREITVEVHAQSANNPTPDQRTQPVASPGKPATIHFDSAGGTVEVSVYDRQRQEAANFSHSSAAGPTSFTFNADGLASGTYLMIIKNSNGQRIKQKIAVIR